MKYWVFDAVKLFTYVIYETLNFGRKLLIGDSH